jgi:hypothetical protein
VSRRALKLVTPAADVGAEYFRTLARILKPYLDELDAEKNHAAEFVVVTKAIPLPRRFLHAKCREGKLRGAVKQGRTWLCPRASVAEFMVAHGPVAVPSTTDGDELEGLRRRLARGGR